jgi:hypothetical protein
MAGATREANDAAAQLSANLSKYARIPQTEAKLRNGTLRRIQIVAK